MDRLDALQEAADHLAEFNIRGALDSLKKTFKEPIDAFKRGYKKGRGLPDDKPKIEPDANVPKHEPDKDEPKADPVDVDVKKTPKKKKVPVKNKSRELKSAAGCAPAPKAKDKIRCPKPGGGHVYYSKDEFKRLRAQINKKSGGRKKK